jgi:hypothetical protein
VIVPVRYTGASGAVQKLRTAQVSFAANTLRDAVFFRGQLGAPIAFREAMAGLHQVVTSDLKYRPRDRAAFRLWLEDQDRRFLDGHGIRNEKIRVRLEELHAQLDGLQRRRDRRLAPFHKARLEYLRWATENEYEVSYLLDPVITVHPDEVFFEAFSRDESSYARVGLKHEAFASVSELECGTTNIDFSHRLAGELSRMRSYRQTAFEIAPAGLAVTTGRTTHVEKKIDLPESWVQGFLQVHSTMAMGLQHVRLAPIDLFNICRQLKRRKARTSPRALRYELVPGEPVRAVLEPWDHVIELSTPYEGPKPVTVRTWGRDRLLTLACLIPNARRVDLYLAGLGLPSIYVLEAEGLTFTLALSGWTDNDWTGGAQFDLLTRRLSATADDLMTVYELLRGVRAASDKQVAEATGLGVEKARSVLSHLCQIGRAMFDLSTGVYRHRDLFFGALTRKEALRAVGPVSETAPPAKAARAIFTSDNVRVIARRPVSMGFKVSGSARGADGRRVRPLVELDHDGQIVTATCTCAHFRSHQLAKGPCEHMLALRLAHMSRLEEEQRGGAP